MKTALTGLAWAQVAARLVSLHAAGLWHGRVNAETILLRGPADVQLLGACSIDSLESATEQLNAGQQPLPLCSPGQSSLEELTALWCTSKVSRSCGHAVPQLDIKPGLRRTPL